MKPLETWAWASTQTESEVSSRCGVPVQTVLGGWPRKADKSSVDDARFPSKIKALSLSLSLMFFCERLGFLST